MEKLPVALQVYSIRDDAANDFKKAMQEVKSMGYDGVELAGLYGHSPEEIRDILMEVGLTPISAHVPYQEFLEDMKVTAKRYGTIGCRYAAIPYLLEEYRYGTENFIEVMKNIPAISQACKEEGITLLYHNHDFEFQKTEDGRYVLDYMYGQFAEDVLQTEMDTCWINVAGLNPAEYLKIYTGRSPIVHLKDFVKEDKLEFRALGQGCQEFESILSSAISIGAEWVVAEQDWHYDNSAMEDARLSREYLRSLGW
jgi:sugar phosphate isomerase/epimerase